MILRLRKIFEIFLISLPLVDAEVLVNYGSDNYSGDKQLLWSAEGREIFRIGRE